MGTTTVSGATATKRKLFVHNFIITGEGANGLTNVKI